MHQDAHEFLNFLLNSILEVLAGHLTDIKPKLENFQKSHQLQQTDQQTQLDPQLLPPTWIQELFEGTLANETKCLTCENVTSKHESFLDLSVDIDQHTSIASCLRNFSCSEILSNSNKFYCDSCNSLQEAEKRYQTKIY